MLTHQLWRVLQIKVFAYSVFYIFFEQYLDIMRTAVISLALATGENQ